MDETEVGGSVSVSNRSYVEFWRAMKRSKHIARRHFYIRDMVEAMQLTVPLVGTADNEADFFTKPVPPHTFFRRPT